MKYMAGSHFSLMYSDVNENERLWVKVEQSLQTCSSAANKSPRLREKNLVSQGNSKICPQNSYTVQETFKCTSCLGSWGSCLCFPVFLKSLEDMNPSFRTGVAAVSREIPVPSVHWGLGVKGEFLPLPLLLQGNPPPSLSVPALTTHLTLPPPLIPN